MAGRNTRELRFKTEDFVGLVDQTEAETVSLPLKAIKRNPSQPRRHFDADGIHTLAADIKAKGLINPVTVRPLGNDEYELVAGERRYRAHLEANLPRIRAIVLPDLTEAEALLYAVSENLDREDLSPIERLDSLMAALRFRFTQHKHDRQDEEMEEVIALLDAGRRWEVSNTIDDVPEGTLREAKEFLRSLGVNGFTTLATNDLPMLRLPPEVLEAMREAKITREHGRTLKRIDDPKQRKAWLQRVIDEGLSASELTRLLRNDAPKREQAPKYERVRQALKRGRLKKLPEDRRRQVDHLLDELLTLLADG